MYAEKSFAERCYIAFKKLFNGCMAIFVACAWSSWFLSILEHWDWLEHCDNTTKFVVSIIWSLCLYGVVSTILYFTDVRDDRRLALQELLGFQFKNAVVALAAIDLFESSSAYGTIASATVTVFMFTLILFISRVLRSYNHLKGTDFEHVLHETEMDGTALACGFALNLALVHCLFGDEGKPSLEGISGLEDQEVPKYGTLPNGSQGSSQQTMQNSYVPLPSPLWSGNSSGNSTPPPVPPASSTIVILVFLSVLSVSAKLVRFRFWFEMYTSCNHIAKLFANRFVPLSANRCTITSKTFTTRPRRMETIMVKILTCLLLSLILS